MRAAVLYGVEDLRILDVPTPEPEPGDLLVRVESCGLCPSDLRLWRTAHSDLLTFPAVVGHEATGRVEAVGAAADEPLLGRRVFVDGYGGFAEYTLAKSGALQRQGGAFLIPEPIRADEAVFVEPLADCLYAVEHCARVDGAATALVVGCGQMGLQLVRLLVLRGLTVVASDPTAHRRNLASAYGAAFVVDPESDDVAEAARGYLGTGIDVAVVACAAPDVVGTVIDVSNPGAVCVLFSAMPAGSTAVDLGELHKRRLTLVGSRWVIGRSSPRFDLYRKAIRLLSDRSVDVRPLLDLRTDFDGLLDALSSMGRTERVKATLHPDGDLAPR